MVDLLALMPPRNKIIVEVRNQVLSEQVQSNLKLILEKAKTLVNQREAIRDQQQFLKPSSDTSASLMANPLRNILVDIQLEYPEASTDHRMFSL